MFVQSSFCQTDTTINNLTYLIKERYENGQAKVIGQYSTNCIDTIQQKHGYFIKYDQDGTEIKRELYFFNEKRNKKILGIKYGWWGWYGMTTKYIFGFATKKHIADPCF